MSLSGRSVIARVLIVCVMAIGTAGCGGASTTSGSGGDADSATFALPLAADETRSLAAGLGLAISVGGGADKTVEVDTGSRGLVVARTAIGAQASDTGQNGHV